MLDLHNIIVKALQAFAVIFLVLFGFYRWKYQYWKKNNLCYLQPQFPWGNVCNPFSRKEKNGSILAKLYKEIKKKGWKHAGFYVFVSPVYMVVDLDYIKNILVKDFDYFDDRGVYYNEKDDPLNAHLGNLGGNKWRNLRQKLNPTFTSSKIKMLFYTLTSCVNNLLEKVEIDHQENGKINICKLFPCLFIDVICSCALGLDCNIFKEENSLFKHHAEECVVWSTYKYFVQILASMSFTVARKLGIRTVPKPSSDFFMNVVADIVRHREENNHIRNDFMQLLIDLKKTNTVTLQEIAAQCLIFFVGGFETSAATLIFALYELAKQEDIQNKSRIEINSVLKKYQDNLTYDSVVEMKYLDQIVEETLRKYPPLLYITRKCTRNYKVPNEDVVIKKGTMVTIPVSAIHYDEEYYPEPEKFDPERFSKENKESRHPYTHLPFGEGPRICIGKRFALIGIKAALASLLKNYKFSLSQIKKEPITMRIDTLVLTPKDDIWLDVHKI